MLEAAIRFGQCTLKSGHLHFAECGSGDLVVLIPGWPETCYAWRRVMENLGGSYHVVAWDPPGIGESSPAESYDTGAVAYLIREAVHQKSGNPILLVGHDVGTWIAYAYAAQWPAEVRALVLLDAALPGISPSPSYPLPPEANLKAWQFSF